MTRKTELSTEAFIVEFVFRLLRLRANQIRYKEERGMPSHQRTVVKPSEKVRLGSLRIAGDYQAHRTTLLRALKQLERDGYLCLDGKLWLPSPSLVKRMDDFIRNDAREQH